MGPHSFSLELNILIKSHQGKLQPTFHRSDNTNMNIEINFEDLLEGLRISKLIFDLHIGDWTISTPKTESTVNKT